MNNLNFNIGITENGNPYVALPEEYKGNVVFNNFFAFEITKVILFNTMRRYQTYPNANEMIIDGFLNTIDFLDYISSESYTVIRELMKEYGEKFREDNKEFLFKVKDIEERDKLIENMFENYIAYDSKLFNIDKGFTVLVEKGMEKYTYFDNEWIKIDEIEA